MYIVNGIKVATLEEALELAEETNAEVFDEKGALVEVAPF